MRLPWLWLKQAAAPRLLSAATNPIGTEHTVTATIDLESNPVSDQTVGFAVSGANSASGKATTDQNGQAIFTYAGANEGDDTITAWIEMDGDNVQNQDEPFAVATKTWVNPVANLTITKTVTNSNILTHTFDFTGDLGDFSLPIGGSQTFSNLAAGSYTIQEDKTSFPDKFWALLGVTCEGNSEPVEVDLANAEVTLTLQAGENSACTFYNERTTFEEGKCQRYLPIILKVPNRRDAD